MKKYNDVSKTGNVFWKEAKFPHFHSVIEKGDKENLHSKTTKKKP
jgi:hypothetical protein